MSDDQNETVVIHVRKSVYLKIEALSYLLGTDVSELTAEILDGYIRGLFNAMKKSIKKDSIEIELASHRE